MLSKVEDSFLDRISIQEEEIILNGPPHNLMGNIVLHNTNDSSARIKGIVLQGSKSSKSKLAFNPSLRVNSKLEAGEQRLESINISLAQDTPPGTYEKYMMVGGKKRKVKMIVQPNIAVGINPTFFTLQKTAPGTVHSVAFTVTNLGNLPFQIPEIKHVGALDMDFLCRALGFAFRKDSNEGLVDTLDRATKNIKENLMNWAGAKLTESGKMLQPGKSMLVHLKITMPANADPKNDYSGIVRFWDKDLSFVIKSHTEAKKTRKNGK